MSVEVLKSTTVSSIKIREAGFNFTYPDIRTAIQQLESDSN
jgi:NAD dependent epimerase/dehydratase family enzyme